MRIIFICAAAAVLSGCIQSNDAVISTRSAYSPLAFGPEASK